MFQKTVEPDADGSLCLLALIMHLSLKGGYLIEYLATLLKDKARLRESIERTGCRER